MTVTSCEEEKKRQKKNIPLPPCYTTSLSTVLRKWIQREHPALKTDKANPQLPSCYIGENQKWPGGINKTSYSRDSIFLIFTLVPAFLHMINRHGRLDSRISSFFFLIFRLFLACSSANNGGAAHVSSNFFNASLKNRSKRNEFPKLLRRQLKAHQWSAAVQRSPSQRVYIAWQRSRLRGRMKRASRSLYSSTEPSKAAVRRGRQKGGETVENLNK